MTRRLLVVLVLGALALAATIGVGLRGRADPGRPPEPTIEARSSEPEPLRASSRYDVHQDAARLGQPRTEAGARDAAVSFATASQRWLYLSDEEIERAVRAISVRASADRLSREVVAELAVARDAFIHAHGRVWWIVRPLATRIDSFGGGRARVSVWTVAVLSAPGVAVPQADWLTVELDLTWEEGAWRVEAVAERVGPTPLSGVRDEAWGAEPFGEALEGFERIGHEANQP